MFGLEFAFNLACISIFLLATCPSILFARAPNGQLGSSTTIWYMLCPHPPSHCPHPPSYCPHSTHYPHVHAHTFPCTPTHIHVCLHTYTHTHAYMHTHTHTCTHMHAYTDAHTHACMHTHTTHTCTHACMHTEPPHTHARTCRSACRMFVNQFVTVEAMRSM